MKIYKLSLLALVALVTFSCSKDENSPTTGTPEEDLITIAENSDEEVYMDISDVESGISVENGTLVNGTVSNATGAAFSLQSNTVSGYQEYGFDLSLQTSTEVSKIFLQLLNEDGSASENYFSIDLVSNTLPRTVASRTSSGAVFTDLHVSFDDSIGPGRFCSYIYVHYMNGTTSTYEEFCVEVEAWGGNPNLVGNWVFTKGETVIVSGEEEVSYTIFSGIPVPHNEVLECRDGSHLEYIRNSDTISDYFIKINEDGIGEWSASNLSPYYEVDPLLCQLDIQEQFINYLIDVKWSYDEENQRLILIEMLRQETGYDFDGSEIDYSSNLVSVFKEFNIDGLSNSNLILSSFDCSTYGEGECQQYDTIYWYFEK